LLHWAAKSNGALAECTSLAYARLRLTLVPLVVSLVYSSNVIAQNSEPEKCYPTNSTIGSSLSLLITKAI
jgi:hypothetical protein